MKTENLVIEANDVTIDSGPSGKVTVDVNFENNEVKDILSQLPMDEIADYLRENGYNVNDDE